MANKLIAEFIGTFLLVFLAVGAAVSGIKSVGMLGVALAFGIVLMALAYSIGPTSGCHVNPAVSLAFWLSKRQSGKEAGLYMVAQFLGAAFGGFVLWVLVNSGGVADQTGGLGTNAFGGDGPNALGAFLTEASQSTVASVEQQFGEIRAATGRERERTAAALRAAYEQANEQMTRLFGEATERFSTAATDIRSMTAEIQRELETTRDHVSRGVADLPRETAEQASTMRRIVGDQIKALNELTSIVTRAGRGHDVAEAAPAMPAARHIAPAPQPAPELRRSIEPQRPQESVAPAPVATPPAPEPQRMRIPAPAPARPAPEPAERGAGWLTDLLARASRDEEGARPATPAPKPIDSLDALSLDIARMLDHDAVVDLWERYRRGERNVFSRRLYTLQGQQAFDEIRRRYRGEREFRETIDRYIHEFERLLSEVGRDDRDGSLAKSYLVSDTGKVYTMLAHAAQRFE